MSKGKEATNPVSKGIGFFQESWVELKKVHPPTKQETIQATILVLIMVVLFAVFLGLADFLVGLIMQNILT